MAEASNNIPDALIDLIRAQLLEVNTAIPGEIVDYAAGIAKVRPVGKKRFADGDALDFPVIPNVRVCWPSFSGGTAGLKGPVKAGDRCLLVFSQQAVDGTDDRRAFDLQDAYAVMCDLGNAGAGDAANNDDLTLFFGSAYLRITAAGALQINAPGGATVVAPTATIDAQQTTMTGKATIQGLLAYQAGMNGAGGSASTSISGDITHTSGTLTSNGIGVHTHRHSGVTSGPSNTGTPV